MSQTASGIQVATPCYFMVIDILGFSQITKNLEGDELAQRIIDWVNLVETTAVGSRSQREATNFRYVVREGKRFRGRSQTPIEVRSAYARTRFGKQFSFERLDCSRGCGVGEFALWGRRNKSSQL